MSFHFYVLSVTSNTNTYTMKGYCFFPDFLDICTLHQFRIYKKVNKNVAAIDVFGLVRLGKARDSQAKNSRCV